MRNILFIIFMMSAINLFGQNPINIGKQTDIDTYLQQRNTIATLSDTSTITDLYDGLLTVVQDTDEIWQYDGTQWVQFSGGGGGTDDQTAAEVPAADAGGYYDGSNVEAQLQEIATRTCYTVPITFSDGQDDIAVIDSAMSRYDCIRIGSSTSDTIDISRPIEVPRSNMRIIVDGYVRVMNGDSVAITANVGSLDTVVNVTSTAGFSVGQWVTVVDTLLPLQAGSAQTRRQAISSKIVEIIDDTTFKVFPPFMDMSLFPAFPREFVSPVDEGYVGQQNSCIVLNELENIIIEGTGVLDVNRQNSIYAAPTIDPVKYEYAEAIRMSSGIGVLGCRNIKITGVTTINPGLHGFAFRRSDKVYAEQIKARETHDKSFLWYQGDTLTVKGFYSENNVREDGLSIYGGVNTGYFEDIHIVNSKRYAVSFRVNGEGGVSLNGLKMENCSGFGLFTEAGDKNITISNVNIINSPSFTAFLLFADNVSVTNIVADTIRRLATITGDNINISNFTAIGDGSDSAIFISGQNSNISNGAIDGFNRPFAKSGAGTAIIANVAIQNNNQSQATAIGDGFTYSNCSGFLSNSNWPYSNSSNIDFFTRYSSGNVYFSQANTGGLGLATKFSFLDRNIVSSYTPYNTLNINGGVTVTPGYLNVQYGAVANSIAFGASSELPSSTANEHYILALRNNLENVGSGDLLIGSRKSGSNNGIGFVVGDRTNPLLYVNDVGSNITITGGSENDVPANANSSTGAALLVSNNQIPRIFVDGFTTNPSLVFRRARGTGKIKTPIQLGDVLGRIQAYGAREDSTFSAFIPIGGAIEFVAAENHMTSGAYGTDIIFNTSSIGVSGFTEKAKIPANGGLSVGSGAFTAAAGVVNAQTGFRVNNTAPSGEYLRGNGTNIVLSAIQESDLPTRPATDVIATDAGDYFTGTDMEAITQELGADLYDQANLRALLGIQRGAVSSSTDASGQISVGHGLSSTPTAVIVTSTTNDSWIAVVVAKNSTQFTVKFFDETGDAVASTSAGFDWVAIE